MKIPILRVRDKDGNVVEIPAIVGPPGPKGEPGVGMGNIQASDVTCENGKTVEEQLAELWQGDASMAGKIEAVGALEYVKNITPETTGCATLLEYMAARYDDHPVIYGYVSGFSDIPTSGQGMIDLCGGVLTVTIYTRTGVHFRGTNSLTAWTDAWRTNYDSVTKPTAAEVGAVPTYSGYISNTMAALDDYKTSGYYTWIAPAYNPFGAIEGALFVVNVEGAMYGTNPSPVQTVTQTYPYAGAGNTFRRTFYQASGGWSEWHRVLMDNGGAIVGALSIYGNAGAFSLVGTDHVYMPLYKNGVGSARSGYMGYGDANTKDLSIVNEIEGGAMRLEAQAGVAIPSGLLYVGGAKVPRIYQSTAAPTAADGVEGDVWHQYV